MKPVILSHISKSFGQTRAVDNVSFAVEAGELFGLIGADGSGKTTLFRILTTLLLADQGEARIAGLDVVSDYKKIRKIIGYMPGRFSLYYDLTVEENLNFFASIFDTTVKGNYSLIRDIYSHIEPFKHRPAGKLSGGMKQKLALSCALIHKPEILILDEPTTGVDAVSRREFWEILKNLRQNGVTILVSTPYMDEAGMCDRIGLIQNGRLLAIEPPSGIIRLFKNRLFAIRSTPMYELIRLMQQMPAHIRWALAGQYIHLYDEQHLHNEQTLSQWFKTHGMPQVTVKEIKPGIEDCFISLMTEKESHE